MRFNRDYILWSVYYKKKLGTS